MRVDEDVVKGNEHKVVEHVMEDVFDEGLKHNKGISQTKGHYQIFKVSQRSVKGGFPLIAFLYTDKIVCITEVPFCEEPCNAEGFK